MTTNTPHSTTSSSSKVKVKVKVVTWSRALGGTTRQVYCQQRYLLGTINVKTAWYSVTIDEYTL